MLHHQLGAADRDVLDLVLAGPEDDAAEQRRQRVVEVDVGVVDADQGVDRALDQVLARLGQHRDRDVLGDPVLLDQLADEGEVGLARGREADLDLLVAHLDEQLEHPQLAGRAHRVDQRLVAVAQVGREPARRLLDPRRSARCGRAGRSARTPDSAAYGIGLGCWVLMKPECWRVMVPRRRVVGRRRAALTPQRGGPAFRPRCGSEGGAGCAS